MNRAGASDSEDDLASASIHRIALPAKSKRAMPRAAAKTGTKRKAAAPKQTRTALKDRTNVPQPEDDEEEVEDEPVKPKAKRAKTTAAKSKAAKQLEIPETQPDPVYEEDVEQSIEEAENIPTAEQVHAYFQRAGSVQPLLPRASAQPLVVQPVYPLPSSRSGSVGAEQRERRGGDPDLRRKLTEMTKKYDDIHLKYQNLQEIGQNIAETNFEKLKKASDQKAKDANDLIASLKKEIAEVRKFNANTGETAALQKQIANLNIEKDKLQQNHDKQVAELKDQLQASQNEAKSLEAKLVAARVQLATSVQESKVPASATKNTRNAAAILTETQKEAKMKENLYSDLTGLIIRGVKRKEGEDEYDCIQTGRNGTLHFHLSVANDSSVSNPKTPTGLSYEEAEFAYEPFLDENRDRDLIALLPDYLAEEICFPRGHAVKFYSKVVESMTKRIVVEDEE